MLDILKKKWAEWLVGLALIIISSFLANRYAVNRDSKKSIQDELNNKADKTYVDQRDNSLERKIENGDANTLNFLKQHAEETDKTAKMTLDLLKKIDSDIDRIEDKIYAK